MEKGDRRQVVLPKRPMDVPSVSDTTITTTAAETHHVGSYTAAVSAFNDTQCIAAEAMVERRQQSLRRREREHD